MGFSDISSLRTGRLCHFFPAFPDHPHQVSAVSPMNDSNGQHMGHGRLRQCMEICPIDSPLCMCQVASVMSDSLQPYGT